MAALPGGIIDLCASATMPCQTLMRPFALGIGIAVTLVGGIDLVRRLLAIGKG